MSRSASLRALLSATALSIALLAVTVGQTLASGGNGPFPR
jgi:hypothetical protein